jgi:hypothetical protein
MNYFGNSTEFSIRKVFLNTRKLPPFIGNPITFIYELVHISKLICFLHNMLCYCCSYNMLSSSGECG